MPDARRRQSASEFFCAALSRKGPAMIWMTWFGAAIAPDASTAFQMPPVGEASPVD
jgi:hypothetical protein